MSLLPLSPSTAASPLPRNTRTQTRTTATTSISPTNTGTARTCAMCHYSVLTWTLNSIMLPFYCKCWLWTPHFWCKYSPRDRHCAAAGWCQRSPHCRRSGWEALTRRGLFCHSPITITAHLLTSVGVCVLQDEAGALHVGLVPVLVPQHRHSVLTALASTIVHKGGLSSSNLEIPLRTQQLWHQHQQRHRSCSGLSSAGQTGHSDREHQDLNWRKSASCFSVILDNWLTTHTPHTVHYLILNTRHYYDM